MKLSTPTIIIAILLSVVLFFVGQNSWDKLFTAILPIVGDVKYFDTSFRDDFNSIMRFSLTLALIPIATILIWRFAPVLTTQRKIWTVCIIIIAMVISVLIRREMIRNQTKHLPPTTVLDYSDPANPQPKTIDSGIPVSTLHFELYALTGLAIGSVISFFALWQKPQ